MLLGSGKKTLWGEGEREREREVNRYKRNIAVLYKIEVHVVEHDE